jgi:hypothetical protein
MPKDWKDITDDEVLNFDGPQTAEIARYDRIMRKRTVDALIQVWAGLFDVKKTLHHVGEKFEARMLEAEKIQRAVGDSQDRQQRVTIGLTVVIAISTAALTWITWQSVEAQREANAIQRKALANAVASSAASPSSPRPAAPVSTEPKPAEPEPNK